MVVDIVADHLVLKKTKVSIGFVRLGALGLRLQDIPNPMQSIATSLQTDSPINKAYQTD